MNNRRIIIVLLAFCTVLIVLLCALAAPVAKQMPSLGIRSDVMNPAGEYVVYVSKDGEWKEVDILYPFHFSRRPGREQ